jgi:hypothetical protein
MGIPAMKSGRINDKKMGTALSSRPYDAQGDLRGFKFMGRKSPMWEPVIFNIGINISRGQGLNVARQIGAFGGESEQVPGEGPVFEG